MAQVGPVIAKILHLTPEGAAVVDWSGNDAGPLVARSGLGPRRAGDDLSAPVLVVFEDGDLRRPVIVGFVHSTLFTGAGEAAADRAHALPEHAVVAASESVEIRCGESSLTLDRVGRVRIKGTQIVSRSLGLQRIKGATVEIN